MSLNAINTAPETIVTAATAAVWYTFGRYQAIELMSATGSIRTGSIRIYCDGYWQMNQEDDIVYDTMSQPDLEVAKAQARAWLSGQKPEPVHGEEPVTIDHWSQV